ncbi:MAG: GGDEF domain-containing protein [Roseibium sp.]|uniref:sensor domain-containing diguanylate cyclase n=1 Tax=Roseibium sp. TaxID=1936156 RepID=UPI0026198441|nr:sensor domain-containing diguanylate cyclase [Roseibium sp.]MCV0427346.1 GGDEF domain-containing protein [Roseibium sp.]
MDLKHLKRAPKNPLFLATAGAAILMTVVALSLDVLIDWQVQIAIRKDAEVRASNWAENYLRTTPSVRRTVEKGIITPAELNRLETSFALAGVIRFQMFDKNGMLTLLSDSGVLGPAEFFNTKALKVYETGEPQIFVHDVEDETPLPGNVETYVAVYLPATLPSGERIGALEVYVDVSEFEEALEGGFNWISGYLIFGTFAVLLLPAAAYVHRTRQVMRKDRQLLELTRYDQLTGVLNRNSISKFLDDHFNRVDSSENLGILFVDLDYFKQVNDHYGHARGDHLLQHIAGILKSSVRSRDDVVGRFGGDEFVVLVRDATVEEFRKLYGRVMEAAQSPYDKDGQTYVPSLSIGAYISSPGDTEKQALHRADIAVYAAKRRGRGQVVEYSKEMEGLFKQESAKQSA